MVSESDQRPPFGRLQFALQGIGALTVAHFNMVEKRSTLDKWVQDQSSIFTKSGVTFLCSVWEAFVEDCASDAATHLVNSAESHTDLPLHLRKIIARELEAEKNELSSWALAGGGWRDFSLRRLTPILEKRLNRMNAPRSSNVSELFKDAVGIDDIETSWSWDLFDSRKAKHWLDKFVEARGAIAHGREPNFKIGAFSLDFLTSFITELARLTHNRVREFLLVLSPEPIWAQEASSMCWDVFSVFKNSEVPPEDVSVFRTKEIFPAHYAVKKEHVEPQR